MEVPTNFKGCESGVARGWETAKTLAWLSYWKYVPSRLSGVSFNLRAWQALGRRVWEKSSYQCKGLVWAKGIRAETDLHPRVE